MTTATMTPGVDTAEAEYQKKRTEKLQSEYIQLLRAHIDGSPLTDRQRQRRDIILRELEMPLSTWQSNVDTARTYRSLKTDADAEADKIAHLESVVAEKKKASDDASAAIAKLTGVMAEYDLAWKAAENFKASVKKAKALTNLLQNNKSFFALFLT